MSTILKNTDNVDYEKRLLEIVSLRKSGTSLRNIGKKYGISYERVRQLIAQYNCTVPESSRVAPVVPLLPRASVLEHYKEATLKMLENGADLSKIIRTLHISGCIMERVLHSLKKTILIIRGL